MGTDAWELVEAGDVRGVMRFLRFNAENLPTIEMARLVERAALAMSFDDLAEASAALVAAPDEPGALYSFGFACMEHSAAYLAVPALSLALERVPSSRPIMMELASALEREERHGEAVAVLEQRDATLESWPDRYLLVYNAIMSGNLVKARAQFDRLSGPDDERWLPAYDRARRILDRSAGTTPGPRDLRGWHYVLTGGILATLSPRGFDQGMTGRWTYVGDTYAQCLLGLCRLRLILDTTGLRVRTVSLLPDRSSRILGLAAASVLGVPAEPFTAGAPATVVVAYDLRAAHEVLPFLRERHPHQVVYEHATCWTDPPSVAADVSTLLVQAITPPWSAKTHYAPDSTVTQRSADERPPEEIAVSITQAEAVMDEGDGETPPDPDENLTGFAGGVTDHWLTGPRDGVPSSGPVPSNRLV